MQGGSSKPSCSTSLLSHSPAAPHTAPLIRGAVCGHVSELDLMQQRVGLVQVVADAAIEVAAVVVAAPVIDSGINPRHRW